MRLSRPSFPWHTRRPPGAWSIARGSLGAWQAKGQFLLFNRISLRLAAAAGAAAVVAGGTFAVSAFADSGASPDQAASAAVGKESKTPKETPFFPEVEPVSKEKRESELKETKKKLDEASGAATSGASGKLEAEKKEKPKKEEPAESGGSSGGSVPSGSPKDIAKGMLGDYGWGADQFSCLEPLWEKESGWNPSAKNPSSGAYGIPQSLPGSKMASAGSDWQTNPATQIEWGLGYIEDRYGSPCGAWGHSQSNGWY